MRLLFINFVLTFFLLVSVIHSTQPDPDEESFNIAIEIYKQMEELTGHQHEIDLEKENKGKPSRKKQNSRSKSPPQSKPKQRNQNKETETTKIALTPKQEMKLEELKKSYEGFKAHVENVVEKERKSFKDGVISIGFEKVRGVPAWVKNEILRLQLGSPKNLEGMNNLRGLYEKAVTLVKKHQEKLQSEEKEKLNGIEKDDMGQYLWKFLGIYDQRQYAMKGQGLPEFVEFITKNLVPAMESMKPHHQAATGHQHHIQD